MKDTTLQVVFIIFVELQKCHEFNDYKTKSWVRFVIFSEEIFCRDYLLKKYVKIIDINRNFWVSKQNVLHSLFGYYWTSLIYYFMLNNNIKIDIQNQSRIMLYFTNVSCWGNRYKLAKHFLKTQCHMKSIFLLWWLII